jgi:hypothetical protein
LSWVFIGCWLMTLPGSTPRNIAATTNSRPPRPPPMAIPRPPPPPELDVVLVSICIPSLKVIARSVIPVVGSSFPHAVLQRVGL